jgi:hypothetical protein
MLKQFQSKALPLALIFLTAGCSANDIFDTYQDDEALFDAEYYNEDNDVYTDAYYSTYDNVIVIHEGRGGYVDPIIAQYEQWAEEGKTIIVDGQVISADAFGAFSEILEGQVCYTDNVIFSPHAASYDIDTPDFENTEILAENLIDPLEQEFRLSPFFNDWIDIAEISAERLEQIWPAGKCDAQQVAYTKLEPNF